MYANTPAAQSVVDRMHAYGVQATGEVVTQEYHQGVSYDEVMTLREVQKAGGRISRVRVLREGRYCDITYIHAEIPLNPRGCAGHRMADGGAAPGCEVCRAYKTVPVHLDGNSIGLNFYRLKSTFIDWAKEHGVFAKGLGLLDESNWAVLSA